MTTATLSARLPDVGQLAGLAAKLSEEIAGVKVPVLPTGEIQALIDGFRLELPDAASLAITVPGGAASLVLQLDPAVLTGPIAAPLSAARELAGIDWVAELETLRSRLEAAGTGLDPQAAASLFGPRSPFISILKDAAPARAFVAVARLLGATDAARLPEDLTALAGHVESMLRVRVGNPLLAAICISAAVTWLARIEAHVRAVGRAADTAGAEERLRALEQRLEALLPRLESVDFADAVAVAALRTAFDEAVLELDGCVHALASTYGFTEAALDLFDMAALRARCVAVGEAAAAIDSGALRELSDSAESTLRDLMSRVPVDPTLNVAALRSSVATALGSARTAVDGLPAAQIASAFDAAVDQVSQPLQRLEELKRQLEGAVVGGLRTLESTVTQVDLGGARRDVEETLNRIEAQAAGLEVQLPRLRERVEAALAGARAALADAREFILDPHNGLKQQIESLFGTLLALFDQLDIAGTVGEIEATAQRIGQELSRIQISPVINSTVDAIGAVTSVLDSVAPLLVTDDLKRKLNDSTAFLRQVDFAEINRALTATMAEIRAAVRADALDCVQKEYEKVVASVGQLDPTPVLRGVQTEVFDPLVAELERVSPAAALSPVEDAFRSGLDAVRQLDPGAAMAPARELFAQINARLDEFDPARLLDPVEDQLAELRTAIRTALMLPELLGALDRVTEETRPLVDLLEPTALLDPLDDGMAALRGIIEDFDAAAVTGAIGGVLRSLIGAGIGVNATGVAGLLDAFGAGSIRLHDRFVAATAALDGHHARLAQLRLDLRLDALRGRHAALAAAVNQRANGSEGRQALLRSLAELDPVARLTPVISGSLRVDAAFTTKTARLTSLADECAAEFSAVDGVADALGTLRSPATLLVAVALEPVRQLLPGNAAAGPRELLLALLDALNPRQWRAEIEALFAALRDQLRLFTGEAVIGPLRDTLRRIDGLVDQLSIASLSAALGGVHGAVRASVAQFDPTPIIDSLEAMHQRVVGLLEALDPTAFIADIDRLYNDEVIGVIRAISPETLLEPPLRAVFDQLSQTLGVLNVERIFASVLEPLDDLEEQLVEGLGRAAAAYDDMLAAIPA
jgi:hypothetical protein